MPKVSRSKVPALYPVLAVLCFCLSSVAYAGSCAQAPYGDTWKHYLQFSLDGALVSKGNLKFAMLIAAIGHDELQSACLAKLKHTGTGQYLEMGLTLRDLKIHDVTQIAAYAQAWASFQAAHRTHGELNLLDEVHKV